MGGSKALLDAVSLVIAHRDSLYLHWNSFEYCWEENFLYYLSAVFHINLHCLFLGNYVLRCSVKVLLDGCFYYDVPLKVFGKFPCFLFAILEICPLSILQ